MTVAFTTMTSKFRPAEPTVAPTVSAGYVEALLRLAVERGADRRVLLKRAGLRAEDLAEPDSRIAFARFKATMRAAKALCGDPALGLHFGQKSPLQKMSIVGLAAYVCETNREVLAQLNRFGRLVVEVEGLGRADRFAIIRRDGEVWLEDRRRNPDAFFELTESTWARFVCEHGHFHPDKPFVKAVHVTHPDPGYRDEYERILKAPVVFGADRNALLVRESWLDERVGRPNRYVFGVFSRHAEALLKGLENVETVRGRVEALLIPILHTGEFGMASIARKLGLSRSTLYRRLQAEGVRYEIVLDELRRRIALDYLEGGKVSLSETAYLVGFSEPSAFSRAFKRWTGARPGAGRAARSRS